MKPLNISPQHPWLAPLAGFSDLPFRLLCRELGCDVAVTEMISAKGLFYNPKNTMNYLKTVKEDSPLIVQLFGEDPAVIEEAIFYLKEMGYKYFDLNAGCPVKKVTRTGAGAALLKDIKRLENILKKMVQAGGNKNVGLKIRLGWDKKNPVYLQIGGIARELDVGWIAIHPRFAKEGFSGKARWECIKELKENTTIPVIASGDIFTPQDAINCILQTKADSVMFARGALKNPLVFTHYKKLLKNDTLKEDKELKEALINESFLKITVIKRHMELIKKYNETPVIRVRGILARYIRGFKNSKLLRKLAVTVNSWEDVDKIIQKLEEDHLL